jgi:hypothetical protein
VARLAEWMKNAFAVAPPGAEPTAEQREVADKVCREIVRRRLTTPALMALEMSRPMNYIGAQAMHFFQPIMSAIFDTRGYETFAAFLENRTSIEYLARRIEALEAECETRQAGREATTDDSPGAA